MVFGDPCFIGVQTQPIWSMRVMGGEGSRSASGGVHSPISLRTWVRAQVHDTASTGRTMMATMRQAIAVGPLLKNKRRIGDVASIHPILQVVALGGGWWLRRKPNVTCFAVANAAWKSKFARITYCSGSILLIATMPLSARCHHYRYWAFKFPQSCSSIALAHPILLFPPKRNDDIPLPGLDFVPVDEPDDETRGRILLRAALGGRQ